jgi:hypothetical protein
MLNKLKGEDAFCRLHLDREIKILNIWVPFVGEATRVDDMRDANLIAPNLVLGVPLRVRQELHVKAR